MLECVQRIGADQTAPESFGCIVADFAQSAVARRDMQGLSVLYLTGGPMSTATLPARSSLPVRLVAENPHGLVSLLKMLRFYAERFCRDSSLLGQLYAHINASSGSVITEVDPWSIGAGALGSLERDCEAIGLASTLAQIKRIKPIFTEGTSNINYQNLVRDVIEVQIRLNDELESRLCFCIETEKSQYMQAFGPASDPAIPSPLEMAWEPVFVSFSSVKYDTLEAFKCYALGHNTACVFHLMRVLELGLTALGQVFGVSLAHTNWGNAIEQIESKIRGMHTDPAWKALPDCKEQQEFYSQAASHFGILKDAWRNYTAHVRGKYDEQEASDIMVSVRAFMQKLTVEGLHE